MRNKILMVALILVAACVSLFVTSCQKKGYAIEGKIDGGANLNAELLEMRGQRGISMKNATLDANGSFKMELPKGLNAGLYTLRIGAKRLNLVLDGKEKTVGVEANLANLPLDYKVTGSEATAYYQTIYKDLIKAQPPAELLPPAGTEPNEQQKAQLTMWVENRLISMQKSINDAKNPLVSMLLALQIADFQDPKHLPFHQNIIKRIEADFPNSPYISEYRQVLTAMAPPPTAAAVAVGKPAPDISFPSPSGETLSLSNLKGKVVLLDFWASWCGPCRRVNPELVALYNKNNKQGFEIFSVSLDNNADKWAAAIAQDGLKWKYHVSDLRGWDAAPAALYGVRSIPQQYVIDRAGNIAAAIQPGQSAAAAIEKLMKVN